MIETETAQEPWSAEDVKPASQLEGMIKALEVELNTYRSIVAQVRNTNYRLTNDECVDMDKESAQIESTALITQLATRVAEFKRLNSEATIELNALTEII